MRKEPVRLTLLLKVIVPGTTMASGELPADGHVHSEWSWDTTRGSMERTCARAVQMGLGAIAFTEHADPAGGWAVLARDLHDYPHLKAFVHDDRAPEDPVGGTLQPPPLDVESYMESVQQCRDRFPDLRILTGVEIGEPHRDPAVVADLVKGGFERVIGSLHSLPDAEGFSEMPNLFRQRAAADVIGDYLAELVRLIEGSDAFAVLGHIDYALRYCPTSAGQFEVEAFEAEFRHALGTLASSGRALEVNTRSELPPEIVRWWWEEGGEAVTFGSDAHDPTGIARGFGAATRMVEANGFRRGKRAEDFWRRS